MSSVVGQVQPAECWRALKERPISEEELFHQIAITLCNYSFSPECSTRLGPYLERAMPLLDQQLRAATHTHRKLKIAYDVAKLVGLEDISTLKRQEESKLIFESALVVLLSFRGDILSVAQIFPYASLKEFLAHYPEFNGLDQDEQMRLFDFANYIKFSMVLLNPKGKKAHLLDMVTRITEGKRAKYVCGGGQTAPTSRRVAIYVKESGVEPSKRPPRKLPWSTVVEALGATQEDGNPDAHLIDTLVEETGFEDQTKSVTSFRHPLQPNVNVAATEIVSADGRTIIREVAVTRLNTMDSGETQETQLCKSISISQPLHSNSIFDWNEHVLNDIESGSGSYSAGMSDGVVISRQVNHVMGQPVKAISISKQLSFQESDLDLFCGEMNLSDILRGGNPFAPQKSGQSGLQRSLSGSGGEGDGFGQESVGGGNCLIWSGFSGMTRLLSDLNGLASSPRTNDIDWEEMLAHNSTITASVSQASVLPATNVPTGGMVGNSRVQPDDGHISKKLKVSDNEDPTP